MPGYYGTDQQIALQKRVEQMHGWTMATPGACSNVRMLGSDDPDRFGLDKILQVISEDGICGFRLLSRSRSTELGSWLAEHGIRLDGWNVFLGEAEQARSSAASVLSRGLPEGLRRMPMLDGAEASRTRDVQAFLEASGIAPFSGSYLNGDYAPAMTVGLVDADGKLAACAHTYLPHNSHSPFSSYAWGGLVAVAPQHRGKGLGKIVNAMMIEAAFDLPGATHIYELVSASNLASRKMVEACGLRYSEDLVCGLATKSKDRFTR